MSTKHLIGEVFNLALKKNIPVYLPTLWNGILRVPEVFDSTVKTAALATVKTSFESGKLFSLDDMEQIEEILIT